MMIYDMIRCDTMRYDVEYDIYDMILYFMI